MGKKKILITGGEGMLGSAFTNHLKMRGYNVRSFSRADLDVRDIKRVMNEASFTPDWVIHTAGIVNADYCEENRDKCAATNVGGTDNVIELCKAVGAKLFYPQSFLIFDGEKLPATEDTTPHPLSVYGEAKWLAEQKIQEILPDALIIRMGGFFGGFEKDKNFVGKFAGYLKKSILEGKEKVMGTNRVWQPTFTEDLVANITYLLEKNKSGTYNIASHGSASFFDVAKAMTEILGLEKKIVVEEVSADYFTEKCVRPQNGTMENRRLKSEGMEHMRQWRVSLEEYLKRPYFRELFSDING